MPYSQENKMMMYEEEKVPLKNDEPIPLGFDDRLDSIPTPERTNTI